MMGTILILATEAAEEGGFGLNLDIFETNLINLAILVGLLVYFGRKVLGQVLSDRRAKIAQAIQEAENRQKKAAASLAEQQKKLTEAQASAERIRQEAQERASAAQSAIASQAEKIFSACEKPPPPISVPSKSALSPNSNSASRQWQWKEQRLN